jgi:hypothetical protein
MNRTLSFLAAASLLLAGCNSVSVPVTVTNPSPFDRSEVVRIDLNKVAASQPAINATNAIVCDSLGHKLNCDVDSTGTLLFVASVPANAKCSFKLKAGKRDTKPMVASRAVPERDDDYSFENFQIAFRAYGKGLESQTISPGFDVWVKTGGKLVCDDWYEHAKSEPDYYHTDRGDGKDCYKVATTLGCGGSAPLVADTLAKPDHNYSSFVVNEHNAIEQSFTLKYAPWKAGEDTVSLAETITIPASGNFVKVVDVYQGNFNTIDVAAGIVVHDAEAKENGGNFVSVWEKPSDSKDPASDGMIGTAVYMPYANLVYTDVVPKHSVCVKTVKPGEELTYYFGAGWSKGNIKDAAAWSAEINKFIGSVQRPLVVEY